MGSNKVSVKIYGQEYVISGEKNREQIVKVAAYVDNQMHEIASVANSCSVTDLAVLSAVNIADESFDSKEEVEELKKLNVQLEKDAQHYVQLWDEAKKNHIQYKEETQGVVQLSEDLRKEVADKTEEIRELRKAAENTAEQIREHAKEEIAKAEAKCKELENSFFDLQMENLQLKKELETYKRDIE
ncbi:MAG: cell division protein ZapA [Firmicutes bacterium]|nr:cell division protein ZapA [Bacillota bacterium]